MPLTMNKDVFITCAVTIIGNIGAQVIAPAQCVLTKRDAA
jgi:hypothetical protein